MKVQNVIYFCAMLITNNLNFQYTPDRRFTFPDVVCKAGESVLVTGQSGCGKTTLLHLMAGILHPTQGSVRINDTELSSLSPAEADHFRGQYIGLIYQRPHFIGSLSIMDNLLLPPFFGKKQVSKSAISALADQLGIGHTLRQLPAQLSLGEQQRASIARALVNQPALILADEPTSALDDTNCSSVLHLLTTQARERGAALVIVTHDGRLKSEIGNQVVIGY